MTALDFQFIEIIINKLSLLGYYKESYYEKCLEFNALYFEHLKCENYKKQVSEYMSKLALAQNKIAKNDLHVEQLMRRIQNLENKLKRYER